MRGPVEEKMVNKLIGLALGLGVVLAAGAAEPNVGTLRNVKGGVMVVANDQVARPATDGMALPEGATILSARDGTATVVLNNGCVVGLQPSQQLTVRGELECKALVASVQQLLPAGQAAPATAGAAEAGTAAAGEAGVNPAVVAAGVAGLALLGAGGGGGGGDDTPASGQ
ncbi:MAG TPA: hypothetical protein PKA16_05920 [Ottowia sp.]|uniref:hypothetical protein n=1 Tax=Ottowia sp. TaxID=1898956 RepID=UPI002BBDC37F|nr:hypothetical protein [Ottowia sp.]HMN20914.1 hypothetical protein [Ottowia sp.]